MLAHDNEIGSGLTSSGLGHADRTVPTSSMAPGLPAPRAARGQRPGHPYRTIRITEELGVA